MAQLCSRTRKEKTATGKIREAKVYFCRVYHPGLKKKVNTPVFTRATDAEDAGRKMEQAIRSGQSLDAPKDMTVLQMEELYLGSLAGVTLAKKSSHTKKWVRFLKPNTPVSMLTRADLIAFRNSLIEEGLAESTVASYVSCLKAAFSLAHESGYISQNIAAGRWKERGTVKTKRAVSNVWGSDWDASKKGTKRKALTKSEHVRLVESAKCERDRVMLSIWPSHGLRPAELIQLRWDNVKLRDDDTGKPLAHGLIRVVEQYQKENGGVCDPKDDSFGIVPLTRDATQTLRSWELYSRSLPNDLGLVFPAARGGRIDIADLNNRIVKPAAKAAGVPWLTPHGLRHTAGSWLHEEGKSLAHIQKHLRHARIETTFIYLHDTDESGTEGFSDGHNTGTKSVINS